MTLRYHVSPAADRDLDQQADYLAREASLDTALRFYDAARTTLENIAEMPAIGERRESRNPRLTGMRVSRILGFEKHLVFYIATDRQIEIVRILHSARDIDSVLDEESHISERDLRL